MYTKWAIISPERWLLAVYMVMVAKWQVQHCSIYGDGWLGGRNNTTVMVKWIGTGV